MSKPGLAMTLLDRLLALPRLITSRAMAAGVALVLVMLVANAWVSLRNIDGLTETTQWVDHTHEVLRRLADVRTEIADAERHQRGYLLTGDRTYLDSYHASSGDIAATLHELMQLTADSSQQQDRLDRLSAELNARLEMLDENIALRGPAEAAFPRPDRIQAGQAIMLRIVQISDEFRQHEDSLLTERTEAARQSFAHAKWTFLLATGAAVVLVLFAWALLGTDLTGRRVAERSALDAERFSRETVDSLTSQIAILDENGKLVAVNQAWRKSTSPDPLIGAGVASIGVNYLDVCDRAAAAGQTGAATMAANIRAIIAGRSEPAEMEYSALSAGAASWWLFRVARFGGYGPTRVVISFDDVTRRKEAQRERENLFSYNRLLLESTGEGIYGIDLQGNCTFINRAGARLLGYDAEALLGKSLHALIHYQRADGTPLPEEDCLIYQCFRQGKGCRSDQEVFWRNGGDSFPVEYSAFPIVAGGTVEGAVVTFSDISARKREEAELAATRDAAEVANQAKSQFLANMSHELRTPLNAVILYSELLTEEAEDRGIDEFIPDLEKIRSAGKHLLALVNGVLDLSKIEAGKMDLYLETFHLPTVVTDVASTVEPLMKTNQNQLKLDCPADLGSMRGDVTRVRQILFNLLSNAAKFTKQGQVALEVRREPAPEHEPGEHEHFVFRIADSGIGMSAEEIEKLFQPFSQADSSTTRKYGGTGLGLAITKRFCEMMRGQIDVSSQPGKGTTFTVRLPAIVEPLAVEEPVPDVPAGPQPAGTEGPAQGAPKVLVIDDEPTVRDLLERFLAKEGFQVFTAADGRAGLSRAAELRPDVIVLDVMMPRLDGWGVLSALKANPELADIPVILLTIVDAKQLGYTLGVAEYLNKPINREQLVAVLRKHLNHRPPGPVLVVEDDPPIRRALRRALGREGRSVIEAENGRVALERLNMSTPPETIILDLMMPEMDGFAFLEELRKNPAWRSIPVIILTAKDLTPADRQRLNGHVEQILEKGAHPVDDLLPEIRKLVADCVATRHFTAQATDGGTSAT